jgi:hypothetical protein
MRNSPDKKWRNRLMDELEYLLAQDLSIDHHCALVYFRDRLSERVK